MYHTNARCSRWGNSVCAGGLRELDYHWLLYQQDFMIISNEQCFASKFPHLSFSGSTTDYRKKSSFDDSFF